MLWWFFSIISTSRISGFGAASTYMLLSGSIEESSIPDIGQGFVLGIVSHGVGRDNENISQGSARVKFSLPEGKAHQRRIS